MSPEDRTQIARRRFLANLGLWAGTAMAAPDVLAQGMPIAEDSTGEMPRRVLGRTQEKLTLVGLGSAPVGHSRPGAASGVPVYRAALEAGINWVDTAYIYDDAEDYLGELMPEWRDRIFLVTKARPEQEDARESARQMQRQFEASLRRLKTDHVDLLHIHSVTDRDPNTILAPGGPLEFVCKMKEQGRTRFIGVTAHNRPGRLEPILATGLLDVLMMAMNFADYHQYPFERTILPLARQQGCGILAMKVFGGHRNNLGGYRRQGPAKMPDDLLETSLRYSLGIEGVTAAVAGVYSADEIRQVAGWARRYSPLQHSQRAALRERGRELVADWGPRFGPTT
jgi:aryl-alcohol dehydrogenase-like predicted oxidoreductase